MLDKNHEKQLSDALHTIVDLFLVPQLTAIIAHQPKVDIVEADLTKGQAAKALGISPRTLARRIAEGVIRITKDGKISQREIEHYRQLDGK